MWFSVGLDNKDFFPYNKDNFQDVHILKFLSLFGVYF